MVLRRLPGHLYQTQTLSLNRIRCIYLLYEVKMRRNLNDITNKYQPALTLSRFVFAHLSCTSRSSTKTIFTQLAIFFRPRQNQQVRGIKSRANQNTSFSRAQSSRGFFYTRKTYLQPYYRRCRLLVMDF